MIKNLCAFALGVCLLAAVANKAQPERTFKSPEIYEFSKRIADISTDKIWPGFDFQNYTRLRGDHLDFSDDPENTSSEAFSWKLADPYFKELGLEEDLVITFHEAFHGFERDAKRKGGKWGAENSMLVFEYQESSARNNALFAIESRLLRLALESKGKSDLKEKVRQFLGVRLLRQAEIDPRFVEFEKGAELNEGLAEYAGTQAVVRGILSKHTSIPFTEADADAFLSKKYSMLDTIGQIGNNIRRKFYYTGSAEGFLLDRMMPEWKTKVQMDNATLQGLLAASIGKLPQSKEVNSFLTKYGYEKILGAEEVAVAQKKIEHQALLDKTLNQKGRRYVIDYSALAKPGGIRSFDPMNVTMIDTKMRVHTRSVTFASADGFTAAFSQPVIEDLDNRRYTTVIPETEHETIKIDGVEIDPSLVVNTRTFKTIEIAAANFKLQAKNGSIIIGNKEVAIKLLEHY